MTQEAHPDALPAHFRLHWYELEHVLGQGGFGITYLARDRNLERDVAIKEYLPSDVAQRRSDASVRPRTQPLDERYRWGLSRFIEEARTLARFDHPNIVRVQSVFEANQTAYMVMRFEQGESLGALLDRCGTLGQDELLGVLLPLLDGLEHVHEAGFVHRDIKPANIYIRSDGSPVLLDFGSARLSLGRSHSMTVLVAPGYAPLEQYHGEADSQGPWTDIYGLAATAYRAISGLAPPDAVLRARGRLGSTADTLVPATSVGQGRYSTSLLAAIDHGLQLSEADRPQSVAAWRNELTANTAPIRLAAAPPPPAAPIHVRPTAPPTRPPALPPSQPAPVAPPSAAARRRGLPPLLGAALLGAGAVVLAGGAWVLWPRGHTPTPAAPAAIQAAPTSGPASTQIAVTPPSESISAASVPSAPSGTPLPVPVAAQPQPTKPIVAAAAPVVASKAQAKSQSQSPPQSPPQPQRQLQPQAPLQPQRQPQLQPLPQPQRQLQAQARPAPEPAPTQTAAPALTPELALEGASKTGSPAMASASSATATAVAALAVGRTPVALAPNRAPASAVAPQPPAVDPLAAANEALRRNDSATAMRMARAEAGRGNARAMELLGRMAEGGHGTARNALQAYIWYSLAVTNGLTSARRDADRAKLLLQPADIAQGDRLVQNWRPK